MSTPPMRPSERLKLEQSYEECTTCKATVCPVLLREAPQSLCEAWKTEGAKSCPYVPQIQFGPPRGGRKRR